MIVESMRFPSALTEMTYEMLVHMATLAPDDTSQCTEIGWYT